MIWNPKKVEWLPVLSAPLKLFFILIIRRFAAENLIEQKTNTCKKVENQNSYDNVQTCVGHVFFSKVEVKVIA